MKKAMLAAVTLLLLAAAFAGGYWVAGGRQSGEPAGVRAAVGADAGAAAGAEAGPPARDGGQARPATDGKATDGKAPPDKGPGGAAPVVPVRPAVPERRTHARFSIELGAFRSADNARLYAAALAERGLAVEIVETMDATGQLWRRVRSGAFSDRWQAEARLRECERIAGLGGIVVTEPTPSTVAGASPATAGNGE